MYDCSPENQTILDYEKTKQFLEGFDWTMINIFGFYGGEPSINTELYDKFIALIPKNTPKFVITNGTWSTSKDETDKFLEWCFKNQMWLIVSSTPEHIKHQRREFLEILSRNLNKEVPGFMVLKDPDEIHAQGRARNYPDIPKDCKLSCRRTDRNTRLGLKPDGNVVFQNCHGEYLTVQTYEQPFEGILERTQRMVAECLLTKRG
jgi:hypothetical protein